jgi:prepilin-type N-terminal cleavage/methylation domain-containing protein
MKTNKCNIWQQSNPLKQGRSDGFSLIELMIATAMFLIVAGAAFSLLASHQPLFNQQQNKASLNINVRNAIAQMQLDLVNAGTDIMLGQTFQVGRSA